MQRSNSRKRFLRLKQQVVMLTRLLLSHCKTNKEVRKKSFLNASGTFARAASPFYQPALPVPTYCEAGDA